MKSEWPIKTLGQVCEKITDGAHQSPKSVQIGKPMASVKDLRTYGVDLGTARHISEEDFDSLVAQGCMPSVGDVLIAKDGNSALDTVCTVDTPLDVVLLSSVAILRPDKKQLHSSYLKYYFSSKTTIQYLKTNFISGAAIPRVVLKNFKKAEIALPMMKEQETIAHILSTLDDKIELNRKMNQTLESMAQAIFKSWFVDFDPVHAKAGASSEDELDKAAKDLGISREVLDLFPSEFEESEVGLIPRGWEVQPISALINLIGGGTPRRSESTYWNGALPWFSVKDMPPDSDVFVLDTEEKITKLGLTESSTKLLKKGTTIISARGTVGKLALLGTDMCMNQSCYGVRGKEVGPFFNYFNLREAVSTLQRNTHGAVFDTITTQTFNTYFSGFCGLVLSFEFENVIGPLMNRIELNVRENDSLRFTRDTLLPKLLSGELDVSNLDLGLTDD